MNSPTCQDPSTDFHAWWLKPRGLAQGCAFWGLRWYCSSVWGWNTPKTPILEGVNRRFQAKRAKYWKFHVIETTASIWNKLGITRETTKWSSWVVLVGAQQIQDGGRPPFSKKTLITISLRPFDRCWWNLARRTLAPGSGSTVKNVDFLKIQDGGGRHLEKSQKLRYLRKGLTDLYESWYADAKWAS